MVASTTRRRPSPARGRRARRGQVLIILVGSMFLMGGSSLAVGILFSGKTTSQIDKAIDQHVKDEARRKQAKSVVEAWKKDTEADINATEKHQEELIKLMVPHDTTRAQLDARVEDLDVAVGAGVKRVLARRDDLRGILTAEEWRAVFTK